MKAKIRKILKARSGESRKARLGKTRKGSGCKAREKTIPLERLLVHNFDPENEARAFYGLFLRGHPLEKLRLDIDVSENVIQWWKILKSRGDRGAAVAVDHILGLRKRTLAMFNHLVENDAKSHFA